MKTNEPSKTDQEIAESIIDAIYEKWDIGNYNVMAGAGERVYTDAKLSEIITQIIPVLTKSKRVSPQEEKTLAKAETYGDDVAAFRLKEAAELPRLDDAILLLKDVMRWHRDNQSADYNECDKDPCYWCSRVIDLLAQRKPLTSSDGKGQADSVLEPKAYPSPNDPAVSWQGGRE